MTASIHPIMAAALRPFFKPSRTDGPWEYLPDSGQIVAPKCGYIPDDVPLALVTDLGGEEIGNGHLMAAAADMRWAMGRLIAELPAKRDWLDPDLERFAKLAIAKADGIAL
jgi:hypothetical protein